MHVCAVEGGSGAVVGRTGGAGGWIAVCAFCSTNVRRRKIAGVRKFVTEFLQTEQMLQVLKPTSSLAASYF